MRYRKKPIVVEAFQLSSAAPSPLPRWFVEAIEKGNVTRRDDEDGYNIHTLEGVHHARRGDWVIQGVKGELYPCKPDIFAATYDEAHDG